VQEVVFEYGEALAAGINRRLGDNIGDKQRNNM
jgi:hypothetical protein